MGIGAKVLGAIQIVVGAVLTYFGAGVIGVPMIAAGVGQLAAAFLAPAPQDPVERLDQRRRPGIRNRIHSPNRPIPLCYGRTVVEAPPVIYGPDVRDVYKIVRSENYQTPGRIRFRAAWGLCMGEITAVEKIFTQDNLDLNDILKNHGNGYTTHFGTKDQTAQDDIAKQVRHFSTAIDIEKHNDSDDGNPTNEVMIETNSEIDSFGLIFSNPRGLFFKETADTRKGTPGPKACRLTVQYRKVGTTAWHKANHDNSSHADTTSTNTRGQANGPNDGIPSPTGISAPRFWTWGGVFVVPIRREFEAAKINELTTLTFKQVTKKKKNGQKIIKDKLTKTTKVLEALPPELIGGHGRYQILIKNKTQKVYNDDVDDIQLIGIEEISFDEKTRFPNLAYVFIDTASTNNLERNFLNMRFIIHGRKIMDLDTYYTSGSKTKVYSENCANIVADLLVDELIGMGHTLDDLDEQSFLAFYDYCNESLKRTEYRYDNSIGTGNLNTFYSFDDFNESSEIWSLSVAGITRPSSDYIQTASGVKFINDAPRGRRKNTLWPNVACAKKMLDEDIIRVRYRTNILRGAMSTTFDSKTSYDEAIKALLDPLSAYLYMKGGKWAISIDQDETPGTNEKPTAILNLDVQDSSFVLVDTDGLEISDRIRSTIQFSTNPRRLEANVVRVKYLNGDNNFKDDVVIVEAPNKINQDGIQVLEVSAQTIATSAQAEQYASQLLRATTIEDSVVQITATAIGQYLMPGDIISITDDRRMWSNNRFRVTNIKINPVTTGMTAEIQCVPYNDDKYNKDIVSINSTRVAPGTAHNITQSNGYLTTSSARDASFRVIR